MTGHKISSSKFYLIEYLHIFQVGICHGDSGGPSIARQFVNGVYRYTLLGVVSGGPDPLQCGSLPDFSSD